MNEGGKGRRREIRRKGFGPFYTQIFSLSRGDPNLDPLIK